MKKRFFRLEKQEVQKVEKLRFFQRGYCMVFGQNWLFFHVFFLRQYRPGKCVLRYATMKKRFFRLEKQEVQKVEKLRFFQRGYCMVFGQNWLFFHVFFLRQYRPGKCVF